MVGNGPIFMSVFNVYKDVYLRPLGSLSPFNRKHESNQNPEGTQPELFLRGDMEPWGKGLV